MLEINAAEGEGGGQVLRTSLTLAAITGQAVRLVNIRARRKNPGLAPQHLTCVLALARVCKAAIKGAALRATEIIFEPRTAPQAGDYAFDVAEVAGRGSAGAVTLLWQTLWLPLALADGPSQLTLRGGTHVPMSPSVHYLSQVFVPTLEPLGWQLKLQLEAWGFYPAGGGALRAHIAPMRGGRGQPLQCLERGALQHIAGLAVAANLPAHIPQRMATRLTKQLQAQGFGSMTIDPKREKATGPGAGLFVWAEYAHARAGFSVLGEQGKPSEQVADDLAAELLAHHTTGAPVDPHLADQLLLPLAFATGPSAFCTSALTQHLLTNAHIIQQFLPIKIEITGELGGVGEVRVSPRAAP